MIDRDTVIQLARNAGICETAYVDMYSAHIDELIKFAQAVAQKAVEGERAEIEAALQEQQAIYKSDANDVGDYDHLEWCDAAARTFGMAVDLVRNRGIGGGE